MIKLDDRYSLEVDTNNVVLKFEETRSRTKKVDGKEVEYDYQFKDEWYFPTLKTALTRYLQEDIKESKDVKEILSRIEKVEQRINQICK